MTFSKVFTNLLIIMVLFIVTGCSTKTVYVDRPVEVKIPVKCQAPIVEKPKPGANMSESMLNIKAYILKLEAALEVCR